MPPKRARRNVGHWSPLRILDSTSPIVTQDVHAFLVTCISGWDDIYDETEKRAIISSLPLAYRKYDVDESGHLVCPITVDFVAQDTHIKSAASRFKTHVSEGYYEKGWQNQAKKAMQERRDGKFDAFLQEKIEQEFGAFKQDDDEINVDTCQIEREASDAEWREGPTHGMKRKARSRQTGP